MKVLYISQFINVCIFYRSKCQDYEFIGEIITKIIDLFGYHIYDAPPKRVAYYDYFTHNFSRIEHLLGLVVYKPFQTFAPDVMQVEESRTRTHDRV